MFWNKRMQQAEQAMFYRQIGMMLASGMSFSEAIDLIEEESFSVLSKDLGKLKCDFPASDAIQTLLAKYPKLFGRFPFELIFDSLDGTQLNRVFQLAADQIEDISEMRARTMRVFWYPALTLTLGFVVFMLLCLFVLPAFEQMFSDFGGALPTPTQWLLSLGRGVNDYLIFILLVVAAIVAAANYYREITVNIASSLPLFGTLVQRIQSYFFARNLGTLLAVNVSLEDAIGFASRAVHYGPLGQCFANNLVKPVNYVSLRRQLNESGCYPQMILQMIGKSASSDADIAEILEHVCVYYKKEIERVQYRVLAVTELLTLALLGSAIGGTVIAMYLPIFKLAGTVGG